MTNIDEIKAIVELAKYHESSELFHEWAVATILELCDEIERLKAEQRKRRDDIHTCHDQCERIACAQRREIESLKSELTEKDAVLGVYANNSTTVWDCSGESVIADNLMAKEILLKYRKSEG